MRKALTRNDNEGLRPASMLLDDAARALGIPRSTLRNYANSGAIKSTRLRNGYRLFRVVDVAAFKMRLAERQGGAGGAC